MHATLRSGSVSVANDKGDCGFKISHRHFVSNGGAHNEPKFGIHQAGPTIASKPPKRSVPPMAPLNPQREALAQREVGPELIALLVT